MIRSKTRHQGKTHKPLQKQLQRKPKKQFANEKGANDLAFWTYKEEEISYQLNPKH